MERRTGCAAHASPSALGWFAGRGFSLLPEFLLALKKMPDTYCYCSLGVLAYGSSWSSAPINPVGYSFTTRNKFLLFVRYLVYDHLLRAV